MRVGDVVDVLGRRGGSATFGDLRALISARDIRRALAEGRIRRVAKGVYATPKAPSALTAARSHGGVVSYVSAAEHWGMQVLVKPSLPHVTLAPKQVRRRTGQACLLHWAEVPVDGEVTTPIQTVLDCLRALPLAEGLAIADSALHQQLVDHGDLLAAVGKRRGPHRRRLERLVVLADGRSESVLESALRAILIEAGIDGFVPQVPIRDGIFSARLDLGHPELRIALEADGFEHHGTRQALVKDCRRHVALSIRGWTLLRFSWEDIMYDPAWVIDAVRMVTGLPPLTKQLLRAA
jgi:very-short-patch-repair endonuclease